MAVGPAQGSKRRAMGRDRRLGESPDFPERQFSMARDGRYYHHSYMWGSVTFDDWWEQLKARAWPFEDAGVNLGVNGARRVSRSVVRFDEI